MLGKPVNKEPNSNVRLFHRSQETTDMALFVRTSDQNMDGWDRAKIVHALVRETYVDEDTAREIAHEVEELIKNSNISVITAPLIRELVDAKLIERGLEKARRMHTRLGVPLFDVDQMILRPNKENANVPHGPEATNLTLAESIKKEYALLTVFSQDIGDAHMKGDIHLHDLGFIDRPYCSGQSLEYIKKYGLSLPNSLAIAKPAKHAEVLLAHMVKFAAALQSNFAGAIGWDAVNIFFAPYLEELNDYQIRQLAQMLIFEFSQQAVARGGQAIFTDINLYWEIPKHFENVPAIGPGERIYRDQKPMPTILIFPRNLYGSFLKYSRKETDREGLFSFPNLWSILRKNFFRHPAMLIFFIIFVTSRLKKATPILCLTEVRRQKFRSVAA